MPKKYEQIRNALLKAGKPLAAAKGEAAAIYNKNRKPGQKPVTGKKKGEK
jgi:hypothetical protein